MSDELASRKITLSPIPLVAMALLAAGVIVKTIPLETSRPQDGERRRIAVTTEQDVEARLWQDPFAAVDTELINLARELGVAGQAERLPKAREVRDKLRSADRAHQLQTLQASIAERRASGSEVMLLGVMVFSGTYPEDTENRRRNRYAVLSGLLASGYTPDDPEHIGYFWTQRTQGAQGAQRTKAPQESASRPKSNESPANEALHIPDLVRYEWLSREDHDHPNDGKGSRRLLLLWLEDETFDRQPLARLSWLARVIGCEDPRTDSGSQCALNPLSERGMAIIGPAGSDRFRAIYAEAGATSAVPRYPARLRFFSSQATAMVDKTHRFDGKWKDFYSVTRTIGGDDALIGAVIEELQLRGVLPRADEASRSAPAARAGVVAIAEGDLEYANALAKLLRDTVGSQCGDGCAVLRYTYLRGLDGMLPEGASATERTRADRSQRGAGVEDLLGSSGSKEQAHGRSQYDYMRRLGDQIAAAKASDGAALDIKAIGIFGSDVYDKLTVLQALRERFPRVLFFTTDLDARFLHPDQARWARNLVVASNFGLALNPGLQKAIPPFRDAYQTAAYLATLVALSDQPPESRLVASWLSGAEARERPEAAAASSELPVFGGKRLYEIGRTRPVELDANGATTLCASLADCANVHSLREPNYPVWELSLPRMTVMTALVLLLLFLTWRRPHQWLTASPRNNLAFVLALATGAFITILGTLYWLAIKSSIDAGVGEPLLFTEGVSMWPAQFIRLASIGLAIVFLVMTWRAVYGMLQKIEQGEDFGFKTKPDCAESTARFDRWLRGPLRPFDDPSFVDDSPPRRRVRIERLWFAFRQRLAFWEAMRWIALTTLVLFTLGYFLEVLMGRPFTPHRGMLVQWTDRLLEISHVLVASVLLVSVVYVIRTTRAFLTRLADCASDWPEAVAGRFEERLAIPKRFLNEWIDFQLIVRLTSGVNRLIYYPFVILLLGIVAHSSFFDASDLPLSLLIMTGLSFAYAIHSAVVLRTVAERARAIALGCYEARIVKLAGQSAAAGATPPGAISEQPERLAKQYAMLVDKIRSMREGAFKPMSEQPVVHAILLTLGGFGGVSIVEYLSLANL